MVQKWLAGRGVPLLALRILLEGFNDFACKIPYTRGLFFADAATITSHLVAVSSGLSMLRPTFFYGEAIEYHLIVEPSYFVFQTSSSIAFLSSLSTSPPKATGLV